MKTDCNRQRWHAFLLRCRRRVGGLSSSAVLNYLRRYGFPVAIVIVIIGQCLYIQFLQEQVDELRRHVESAYDFSNHDSFDYRITNLEHISNSHGDRLKELESDNYLWKTEQAKLTWRVMQLEWATPSVSVQTELPKEEKIPQFNSNPGNVPWPSFPNNDIYIHPDSPAR